MADIFISYSSRDPEPTKALAADLETMGYTTWWDTSLLPGDRFPEKIRQELEAAKAVIVIWSEHSAKSEWVYSEAQLAQGMGKLITVHVPGFDVKRVPIPFNGRHTEPITNRVKVYSALEAISAKMRDAMQAAAIADVDVAAIWQRANDYKWGRGVVRDETEAVRLFREAAEMGSAKAIRSLGCMYEDGCGVRQDFTEAINLYRKAAELGEASASTNLGNMYWDGRGVARDVTEALRLFKKAAHLGCPMGAYNLALSYEYGRGIEKNREEACHWYSVAASKGDNHAAAAFIRLNQRGFLSRLLWG